MWSLISSDNEKIEHETRTMHLHGRTFSTGRECLKLANIPLSTIEFDSQNEYVNTAFKKSVKSSEQIAYEEIIKLIG